MAIDQLKSFRKRKLHLENICSAILYFWFCLIIIIPIMIALIIPLYIISILYQKIIKTKSKKYNKVLPLSADEINELNIQNINKDEREYDIVLFGATGFTGRLVALYLANHYGMNIKWALAGRNESKLKHISYELQQIDPALQELPILIADSFNANQLNDIVSNTKCIITTVGPYALYGTRLLQLCAYSGTDYVDITGESDWVREMIDRFDNIARENNARIVVHCGHDCIPWDLGVYKLAEAISNSEQKDEEIYKVHAFDEVLGEASGGTLATLFVSLSSRKKYRSVCGFDPLMLTKDNTKSESKIVIRNQTRLAYNTIYKSWVGPFVMAPVMSNCIRRSNALNNYSKKFTYSEYLVYPNFCAGFVHMTFGILQMLSFSIPPLGWIFKEFFLPKPGEGPSEDMMNNGFLNLTMIAVGTKGTKKKLQLYFDSDPGYKDTARLVCESALCFIKNNKEIDNTGGVFTPASCLKDVLLQRLIESGTQYSIEDY